MRPPAMLRITTVFVIQPAPLVLEAPLRDVNRICGFLLERDSLVTRVPAGIIHCRRVVRVGGSYAEWRTR